MSRVDRPLVEELLKVTTAESPWGMADSDAADLCNYILRLESDLAEAVRVMEPFAEVSQCFDGFADKSSGLYLTTLTVGDLRAAAAFLAKHK